jgi:formylglycine-generating enzyme required for sulfatase activity
MKRGTTVGLALVLLAVSSVGIAETAFQRHNQILFRQLAEVHGLTPEQMTKVKAIFDRSGVIGQGNPAITEHPLTPEQCLARLPSGSGVYANPEFEKICQAKYMAPLYNPKFQRPEDARACIDQFEFPDIPCAYPVVWVKAVEAAEICEAVGKRLCDAHEWEGACAGALQPPDYRFDLAQGVAANTAVARMAKAHNRKYEPSKIWSYGPAYQRGICAAASRKSATCSGGGWSKCGSNTYPTGSFPDCRSTLGVYDLNGNSAEHMSLPLRADQMASRGSKGLGVTEMKGSWFIFDSYRAHPDWCRWRAPYWHGSRVMDPRSHANYHLGFRCCKTLKAEER